MKIKLSPRNCLKTAALIGLSLVLPLTASAQQNSGDTHGPAAPAGVERLQNQAATTAPQPDPETMAAIRVEMHADQAVQAAMRNNDDPALERARANHRAAEMHAEALVARTTGGTPEQIAAMRSQGMGWGRIARNMGVHPGVLGLGHDAETLPGNKAEMGRATARNVDTGRSATHGDRTGAAGKSGSHGTLSQSREPSRTRNSAQSQMSRSSAGSRAGHSSRSGHSASHGGGHHH